MRTWPRSPDSSSVRTGSRGRATCCATIRSGASRSPIRTSPASWTIARPSSRPNARLSKRRRRDLIEVMRKFALAAVLAAVIALPQEAPKRLVSPQVHSDGSVTFRFHAPNAQEVSVVRVGGKELSMQKSEDGVWSGTTEALDPDYYGYAFHMDGTYIGDPSNPVTIPNLLNQSSEVHVPGPPTLPWETNDV